MLPINVVFLIVRDHFNEISDEDKQFCTNIIIKYAYNTSNRFNRKYNQFMGPIICVKSLAYTYF